MNTELTIPANTKEATPVSSTMTLMEPYVRVINVTIPEGHKFLARLFIISRGLQLVPSPGSGAKYIRGNDDKLAIPINRRLEGPPYEVTVSGWNEDDTYPHTFFIEVL